MVMEAQLPPPQELPPPPQELPPPPQELPPELPLLQDEDGLDLLLQDETGVITGV